MAYVDGIATMGRGGLGAVLGAKNLKAVVVTGTGESRLPTAAGINPCAMPSCKKSGNTPI